MSHATLSPCGQYRYTLSRDVVLQPEPRRTLLWVMLNPSTADATQDDPTIRRVVSFTSQHGFTDLVVANLYAFRATNPMVLRARGFPVGPDNDAHLSRLAVQADTICAAWGTGGEPGRIGYVRGLLHMYHRKPLMCLGVTKDGSPRHPLYMPGNSSLMVLP